MKSLFTFLLCLLTFCISCNSETDDTAPPENQNEEKDVVIPSEQIDNDNQCQKFSVEINNWEDSNYTALVKTEFGKTPIKYVWSNGSTDTIIGRKTPLAIGTYSVTATDWDGCVKKASIEITHQLATFNEINVACIGSHLGVIDYDLRNDFGNDITEKGVCYSTRPNPTIKDIKVIDTSFGSEVTINSLDLSTTYYVRAYVMNQAGLSYSEEISFTTRSTESPFRIGQRYQGGIIAHLNCDGISGFILYTDRFLGRNSLSSARNTTKGLTHQGYDDWYLPGVFQMGRMYLNLHKTGIYTFATGDRIFDNYWTSDSISDTNVCGNFKAFHYDMDQGSAEEYIASCFQLNVAAVRNFKLPE